MKKVNIRIIIYIFLVITIIYGVISIIYPQKVYASKTLTSSSAAIVNEINNNDVIEQTFISDGNYEKFGIYFGTYETIFKKGKLILTITDENDKEETIELKLSKLSDNNYYYFDYSLKKDKEYMISLTIKNSNDPISVYALDEKPRNSTLTFNGESQDNIVALSFMYGEKSYFNVWYSLMGIVLLTGCLVMTTPNRRSNVWKKIRISNI